MSSTTSSGDLRLGLRALGRRPTFTAAALVAIALGVGLNTAIFSLADRVFLRPLAYPSSERLGLLSSERILDSSGFSLSYLELRDVAERNRVFEELAIFLDWLAVYEEEGASAIDRSATDSARAIASTSFPTRSASGAPRAHRAPRGNSRAATRRAPEPVNQRLPR